MIGDSRQTELKRGRPQGLSLLETVVAVAIFSVLVVLLVGMFVNTLTTERRAIATQTALDSTRYTLEVMARAIRQANPNSLVVTNGGATLRFAHASSSKNCPSGALANAMRYSLSGNSITEESNTTGSGCPAVAITPSTVRVENLQFTLGGQGPTDGQQPRVTISMQVSAASNPNAVARIENTVSLRSFQE